MSRAHTPALPLASDEVTPASARRVRGALSRTATGLRSRLVAAFTVMTVVTLGGAFAVVAVAVNHSQERQFDEALLSQAEREAAAGGAALTRPGGPVPDDLGPLKPFAAVYGPDAAASAFTPTFRPSPPPLEGVRHPAGVAFDFWFASEHLRGLLVPLPHRPGSLLLFAAPRMDLDRDATFLSRAMLMVFAIAVAWSGVITAWAVSLLTRDYREIASVARRVAAGDLTARIGKHSGDHRMALLAEDLNEMIGRVGILIESEQRFIAKAAHELRTPLTTLCGELSHALRRARNATAYREAIEAAAESAQSLKRLTDDLLHLSRRTGPATSHVEVVRVRQIMDRAAHAVAAEARELGVCVRVVADDDLEVAGRAADLERVARNLFENAIRHSPSGGVVEACSVVEQGAVVLSFTDEGPGVPAADQARIFEPFFRGMGERRGESSGVGLGLCIVQEIVRAHRGTVRLDPTTRGARFVVELPLGGTSALRSA